MCVHLYLQTSGQKKKRIEKQTGGYMMIHLFGQAAAKGHEAHKK